MFEKTALQADVTRLNRDNDRLMDLLRGQEAMNRKLQAKLKQLQAEVERLREALDGCGEFASDSGDCADGLADALQDIRETVLNARITAPKDSQRHQWDRDGERCVKCGDKDWMAGPVCTATAPKEEA